MSLGVHVASTGLTPFGRRSETLVQLMAQAGGRALEGVGRKPTGLLVVGNMLSGPLNQTENLVAQVADRLGLDTGEGLRIEAASASGAAAFHAGALAVASGHVDRVLVVAGEKMSNVATPKVTAALAHSLAPLEQAAGATMPALAALIAQRYALLSERALEAYDQVSVNAHAAARQNPAAQFREPIRIEDVRSSRPVALPLRLYHCAAISDGAAAAVIERGEGEASVLGLGQGFDALMLSDRAELTSFKATRLAARRAYEAARLTRKEVGFAELHDAFSPFLLIDLEDIGVCGAGDAADWVVAGETGPAGRFPVNPSGGLLGRGHPVGASGLVQIVEVCRQLRGEAEAMQLPSRPSVGLAQSIGGLGSHDFATILGRGS